MSSLLSKFKGYRTLVINGVVFVTAVLAGFNVIPTPIDVELANAAANNVEAVLNASENLQNVEALSAGVTAAVALVNMVLRLVTTTPAGQKK